MRKEKGTKTMPKERLDEDDELERYCPKCDEWWPADREFFYGYTDKDGNEVLHSWCKACYLEFRKAGRAKQKELVAA